MFVNWLTRRHSRKRTAAKAMIFLHIPKTGGTTVFHIVQENFDPNTVFVTYANPQQRSFDEYIAQPMDNKPEIRVVFGHMNFGMHRHLQVPFSYATILRHPVDRMISHYYYILRCQPNHPYHHAIKRDNLDVAQYACRRLSNEFDNHQVRALAATKGVPYGKLTRHDLQLAMDNLDRWFSVVGVLDHFDQFTTELKAEFKLQIIGRVKRNVTLERPSVSDLSQSEYDRILGENALDMELYEYVKSQVEERMGSLSSHA
jgi:hypothetical protein